MRFANVAAAISVFAQGGMVVVTDDDDRENEGDLIMGGCFCTPEKMAFIIHHTSGIVCAPMTRRKANMLDLHLMVETNQDSFQTAFTISVDAKAGNTTGISAQDRSNTVVMLATSCRPEDFVRPGHVFPLLAKDGGLFERPGHTEAAVDLCRVSGVAEVAVIAELMNVDGTVMQGTQLADFAATHHLPKVSVSELIAYRLDTEQVVQRISEDQVNTRYGLARRYRYVDSYGMDHYDVISFASGSPKRPVPLQVCIDGLAGDAFDLDGVHDALLKKTAASGGVIIRLDAPAISARGDDQQTASARCRKQQWQRGGLIQKISQHLGVAVQAWPTVDASTQRDSAIVGRR
ncbi:3,4-dihydroxy-2-butanone 4-phosphate synthase [Pigmentiphaga litoralis]|uniref:3,4-dihydroxy-2-butanone-4-phosphate synthase n=1 Tax=Pigmentiphaga litoralis TaxID=516702 RepID=UPI00167874CE|nr:3,4-dihydroxy-2-butanone-4-phosphate synthase [Pigmentiphaga litoralis]GGX18896.1 3,4-dihydroxy-2-butanone 4-phosphate synthase [Pigmentiphaga litoralis]